MTNASNAQTDATGWAGADLAFAGVARQGELLRAGDITPRQLVECYLERIERLNPPLNAFVSVRAEAALAEADAALERLNAWADAQPVGSRALHGRL
jgi:amidase